LKDSNVSLKMNIAEEGIGVHSLAHITLGKARSVEALRWGLRQVTNGSILDMDLHKPNNKLVSA
jgi:hypothetical protein